MNKSRRTNRQAKVVSVIEVTQCRGQGIEESPFHTVVEYWTMEGKFIGELNPCLAAYIVANERAARGFH